MAFLDRLIQWLLVLFLSLMSLVVALNVFCRFVLNFSLYWADELAQILLVWLTFIGAAQAIKERSHYVLHFLSSKLKGRALKFLLKLQEMLLLLSIICLLYYSTLVAWQIGTWLMPATEVSRSLVYSACPIGCLLMLYYATKDSFQKIRENQKR